MKKLYLFGLLLSITSLQAAQFINKSENTIVLGSFESINGKHLELVCIALNPGRITNIPNLASCKVDIRGKYDETLEVYRLNRLQDNDLVTFREVYRVEAFKDQLVDKNLIK